MPNDSKPASGVTNEERVAWATEALRSFARAADMGAGAEDVDITGPDMQECFSDLLCDLRHFAAKHGLDFDAICGGTKETFEQEVQEEAEWNMSMEKKGSGAGLQFSGPRMG